MQKIKKICLITPGHIATNPRLIKEAASMVKLGFDVHVVFTQYMDYLLPADAHLLQQNDQITFSNLVWTKNNQTSRFFGAVLQKLGRRLFNFIGQKTLAHKLTLNRNYFWQLRKSIATKADLYIAHNAGAIAVAGDAAKKNGTRFAFDAEDYHRGEDLAKSMIDAIINIENHYLPNASYLTAASPLIAQIYGEHYQKPVTTLLNVFPKPLLMMKEKDGDQPLKLFWFSQTVGLDRGIEAILVAMGGLKTHHIELHLLGNCDAAMRDKITELATGSGLKTGQICYYKPIFNDQIFELAARFDLGMASETGVPLNRDICLTNKIFTYLQAGLAVLASDTRAQVQLIQSHPQAGSLYGKNSPEQLQKILSYYMQHPEALKAAKANALNLAESTFNWEKEEAKLQQLLTDLTFVSPIHKAL